MRFVSCLVLLCALPVAGAECPNSSSDAVAVIRCRYLQETLPADAKARQQIEDRAEALVHSMKTDGTWADVDYVAPFRSEWPAAQHLNRVLIIAKAAYLDRENSHANVELEAGGLSGLRYWLRKDPSNPNWWWNQIGVPQLLGEIGLLLEDRWAPEDRNRMLPILKRSEWNTWTGANLVWGVTNQILRGVLYRDEGAVKEAYDRLYQEIRQVPQFQANGKPGEGIQMDNSFHQHGAQFYSGGYGLDYTNYAARYITYAWGTPLQIPADKMQIFTAFVLDGQQWMVRGDIFDYAAVGREITRKDEAAVQHEWTHGPIAGYDAAYTLANVMEHLAELPVPRQAEFRAFADRLRGQPRAAQLGGNRMFWNSDYMVQRGATYSTFVKMFSTRIQNSEITNSEGRWSTHLSDGMNLLYRTGNEYRGIFVGWDWALVPGTTAVHAYRPDGAPDTGEFSIIDGRGKSDFVGGVSDGNDGVAAMDLERGTLTAKKAWFFFDSFYVALGAGITQQKGKVPFVATDLNQTLLRGPVTTNLDVAGLKSGSHAYRAGALQWVNHDGVGYVIGKGLATVVSNALQSGRWSNFGTGSDELAQVPVLNLWIDHGAKPQGATYEYEVLPNATTAETAAEAAHPGYQTLSNTEELQAVLVPRLKVVALVAHKATKLDTSFGVIAVDNPALVMVREESAGFRITAANPRNQPMLLHVSVHGHTAELHLPDGAAAGSSVTVHLDR